MSEDVYCATATACGERRKWWTPPSRAPIKLAGCCSCSPATAKVNGAPSAFIEAADTVTEMRDVAHAFRAAIAAQKGIDL